MKQLALAFQFLTIVPIRVKGTVSGSDLSGSAVFFPLVGAFQGLLAVCAASLLSAIFPAEITCGLVIVVLILSNGGFHLDGLADTFDALAVKSSGNRITDREKRLTVMKDSATGAIGVVAIVVVILLKFLLVKELFAQTSAPVFLPLLFLMPVYSKWAMVPALYHGRPAREDGLGRLFMESTRTGSAFSSFSLLTLISLSILLVFLGRPPTKAFELYLLLSILLYVFSLLAVRFCANRFGGLTGDNFGAISEISEILFLMVALIWLRHFI